MIRLARTLLCIALLSVAVAAETVDSVGVETGRVEVSVDSLVMGLKDGDFGVLSRMDIAFYQEHQNEILDSINALAPVERRRATLLLMQWDFMKFKAGNVDVSDAERAKDITEIQELADSVAADEGAPSSALFLHPAFHRPFRLAWIGLSLFYNPVFGSDAPDDVWLGGFRTVVGLSTFGGDLEWRVGVNFGHNGDDEFSYYGYRIKGQSGFSMIDMEFTYGYAFYEGTRQRVVADAGVGWWSGNVPEDRVESQYLFYYSVGLRYDLSFSNRNVQMDNSMRGVVGFGVELDMNYANIVAVKADVRIGLDLLW